MELDTKRQFKQANKNEKNNQTNSDKKKELKQRVWVFEFREIKRTVGKNYQSQKKKSIFSPLSHMRKDLVTLTEKKKRANNKNKTKKKVTPPKTCVLVLMMVCPT